MSGKHNRIYRRVVIVVLVIMCIISAIMCLTYALGCIPVQALWDPKFYIPRLQGEIKCLSTRIAGFAGLGSSLAFDLIVTCFPLYYLHQLQLRTHQKWALGGLFSLGFM